MFEKKVFGSVLRLLRQQKGISQSVLADYLNVTKTQISDIENGKIATTLEKLCSMADFFDVSTDYLLGRSDDPARH